MIRTIFYPIAALESATFLLTEEQDTLFDSLPDREKAEILFNNLSKEEQEQTSIQVISEHFKAGLSQMQPEKGVCRVCGCSEYDACTHPEYGTCWWADETETLCSHCATDEIKNDPRTKGPKMVRTLNIKMP